MADLSISYDYTKQRKEFGIHPSFGHSQNLVVSIAPDESEMEQWIRTAETTVDLDCIPKMAVHDANTEQYVVKEKGTVHCDGAWPQEVKTNEFVDRQRALRRIKNEVPYQQAVVQLMKNAEVAIQQNNTIDLFEDYFLKDTNQYASEPPTCKTVSVFRDPNEIKRSVTHLCWHPDLPNKIACSYSILQFQQMPDKMPMSSYIWNVNKPNEPEHEIVPQSPLCCLVYNPRSPDFLVGGSYNGLVATWDLRKGSHPVDSSILEKSHHDPVYDIFWIQSRTGNECVSVSTDGTLLWWDTRKLEGGPMDSMELKGEDNVVYGGTSLDYKSEAGATRYLVGTEQGHITLIDRKAKKDAESTKGIKNTFGLKGGQHHGPVYSVMRNPTNLKYFLSVGDWTARVWMEDIKQPLMQTRYDGSYLTAGSWSPTRPGVFFTTKADGTMDVWDYFYKQNEPCYSTKIGEVGLTSLRVQGHGKLVALGSEDGTTTIVELSSGLSDPQPNEKHIMTSIFERETKREKNLEVRAVQRQRELKEKAKQEGVETEVFDPSAEEDDKTQADLKSCEEDFYKMIEKMSKAEAKVKEEAAADADNCASADEGDAKDGESKEENKIEAA